MKKQVFGRKFKRDINERKALFKGLISELAIHESIQTTEEKAKAVKGDFEKLVTKAKKGGQTAYRLLQPHIDSTAARKMIDVIGPRFATRPGGYTRIIRLNKRFNDNAQMVMLELVEKTARGVQKAANTTEKVAEKTELAAEAKISEKKNAKKAAPKKPAKAEKAKDDKKPVKKAKKESK